VDAAKRRALVDRLAVAKNFDKNLPDASRRWFVLRLIRTFDAQFLPDAQIEAKTTEVVTKSRPIVKARKGFSIGLTLGRSLETILAGRRVAILYGAIAMNPEFVDPANGDLLAWIAKRRLRAVMRMDVFVNPNYQGYFRYPHTCPTNEKWRVNVDAQAFWEASPNPPQDQFPFPIKRPANGDPDYVQAVSKLYVSKRKPCDGNLLDCAVTTGAVFLDSMLEAKDPAKLLKKLDSRVTPNRTNVAIHHVSMSTADSFIGDPGAEGLFERGNVLVDDLQVGDHVYIFNHPLYKVFRPNGSWRGEHSLVYDCGNREVRSRKGYTFGGHGKEGTVYAFYDDFLAELQTYLHRAFRIAAIFLVWEKSGRTSIPSSQIISDTDVFDAGGGITFPVNLHQFNVTFKYRDFQKAPTPSKKRPTKTETGFVIVHFTTTNQFVIAKLKTLIEVIQEAKLTEAIPFSRDTADPGDTFEATHWSILYDDLSTGDKRRYDLFRREKGKLTFKPLTIDELFASPFAKRDPKSQEIATTRPRVSFTAAYRSFLSTNGAI
jgi:hypothetical protein